MATLGKSTITELSLLNPLAVKDGGTGVTTIAGLQSILGLKALAYKDNITSSDVINALGFTPSNTDNNTTYTIATGDSNGQIKVTPSVGDAYNVSVKGLAALAYKSSLSKGDVGLGNVENTALSTWTGSSKLTTCAQGTIIGSNNIGSQSVNYANSAGTASSLSGGYLNTHPENGPTVVPFINNDIAFLSKKGGSYKIYSTTSTDYSVASLSETSLSVSGAENMFDGSPSYTMLPGGSFVAVIDMTLHRMFPWGNVFYIDFGASGWRAKKISVYVMNSDNETSYTSPKDCSITSNSKGNWYCQISHSSTNSAGSTVQGFNRLRVVLGDFNNTAADNTSGKRISQVGIISYNSAGVTETYISRGGCSGVYGSLVPHTTNSINLGSSSKKWANVYATTFNGNATSATKATQDASGNVITTTYATKAEIPDVSGFLTSSALSGYLPLTGGTLAATSGNTPLTIKGTASGNDAWIAFHNNSGFLASLGFDSSKNLKVYKDSKSLTVWHEGNDGSGSGLDADTLDGYHASSFSLAHDHNYLPLSGGTISGVLCVGQTMSQYAASRAQFSVVSSSTDPAMIWLGSNKERTWSIESRGAADDYAFSLYSWVNTTHVLRIKHDGNVGIGTTSPSYKLHVGGTFNASTIYENGTRVLTGITSQMVIDALGYTPIQNETDISNLATKSELSNYVSKTATGVQGIAGGLVVGASRDDSQAAGRIMLTGSTNPLIGIRATGGTAFYFQSTGDIMYLGPTSSRAMAFTGSTGDVSFPGNVTIGTTSSNKNLTVNGEVTAKKFNGTASDSNKLGGKSLSTTTNNHWNGVPFVGNDGVMEIGKYVDFHSDNTSGGDFSTRLQSSNNNGNTVTLPSESGTLALTKDLPDTSVFVKTSADNTFTGKNIFTATATFNTPQTQKFVVGDSSSAFVFGSDGLQCFSGTSSTSAKVMYMNYYGGAVYIGKQGGTQEIGLRGTVTANGVAVATTNDLSSYLLLTGGTMSGNITFPSSAGIYESTRHLLSSSTSSTYVGNQDVKTVLRAGAGLYADINGTRHSVIHAGNIGDYIVQNDGTGNAPDASTYAFINGSNALGTWPISISGTAESCNHAANDGDGNNISSTYLKKSGDTFTGTVSFKENTVVKTRVHGGGTTDYNTGWYNGTAGNEALAFVANADVTSFMFVQGHSTKLESWNNSTWQSVTPAMQIKKNSVYINSLIANGITPEYKFYVNGISAFNGNVAVTGNVSASGTLGGSLANSLTVFGKAYNNSSSITIADTDLVASLESGNSILTDSSEILTSYASNNGFSDSSGKNKIYKRKASLMYDYIKGKTDSVYVKRDGSNTITGNLTLMVGESHDSDQFIRFMYSSTDLDNFSWRLGYIGTGSGNENYFVIQSNHNNAWNSALQIGLQQYDATFKGNVTAPKFIGALQGNASTATSASSASIAFNGNYYGVCDTAANVAAKTVTISGFPSDLSAGQRVTIKFVNKNSASSPTLNVNGLGAFSLYRYGTSAISTTDGTSGWHAGAVVSFTFDGTNWVRDYWYNTTYSNVSLGQGYATCSTAASTVAKTASLSSYALTTGGIVSVKFTYDVPAGATLNINSKGAKAIYYRGSAITAGIIKAGDTATFIYSTNYHLISVDKSQYDFLPLSGGGMLTGNGAGLLAINRQDGNPVIEFRHNGSLMGRYGFTTEGTPIGVVGGAEVTLIHSSNYSSYALPLSGGTLTSHLTCNGQIRLNGNDLCLKTNSSSSDDSGDIAFYYGNGKEKARIWTDNTYTAGYGPNYRVNNSSGTNLYNGRLATIADNVASATKLATARTIWGQSFDGTGNVSGNLNIGTGVVISSKSGADRVVIDFGSAGDPYFGYGTASAGIASNICGNDIYFRYGTSRTAGIILNSSGNVSISSTDLASTSYKLYVEGTAYVNKLACNNKISSKNIYAGTGNNVGVYFTGGDDYAAIALHKNDDWLASMIRLYTNKIEILQPTTITNAVTMSSSLTVDGNITANGVNVQTEIQTKTGSTATLEPNVYYIWHGSVSSLSINFNMPVNYDIINNYMFQFTASSSGCTFSLPEDVKWQNGAAPTIVAGKTYQFSITNAGDDILLGVYTMFS